MIIDDKGRKSDSQPKPPTIELCRERRSDGSQHHLWAYRDSAARLVIAGQDFGPVTRPVSGDGEYEYWYTIDAEYLPRLIALLGGLPGEDILNLLKEKWTDKKSDELGPMLRESDLPVGFSCYSG